MCCNKQFNVKDIPIVDRWDYDEIMITGGEPMLYPDRLERLCNGIREVTEQIGFETKDLPLYVSLLVERHRQSHPALC